MPSNDDYLSAPCYTRDGIILVSGTTIWNGLGEPLVVEEAFVDRHPNGLCKMVIETDRGKVDWFCVYGIRANAVAWKGADCGNP
jgi:hypothetical protein